MNLNDCHTKLGVFYRYSLAIILFSIALAIRLQILPIETGHVFITFYPLIVVVFYLCVIGPGIFTIVLSAIGAYHRNKLMIC
ncbi:hypothetical protein [Methylomonas sp. AM2-LC]|uniref:hypothetical protein n=1 Tax=Methylomonas sp. AM2-LC TaxID=3153301 RepID=UPI0032663FAA